MLASSFHSAKNSGEMFHFSVMKLLNYLSKNKRKITHFLRLEVWRNFFIHKGNAHIGEEAFFFLFFLFFFWLFAFSGAAPAAYGGSQARGLIGATAAGLHHSSRQRRILNLLSEARGRSRNLKVPSWIRLHCATTGTPPSFSLPKACITLLGKKITKPNIPSV